MPAPATRVMFLGLDGGTMAAFGPLFGRGLMPNLAALWRRSARGVLRSSTPMVTPVAWTSFSTGCTPPVHGIHEFYHVESADRTVRPNHAGRVRVPTIWQILSASGREVVSLNLPMTYPPPSVRGIVVAGADAPGRDWAFAQCPAFGEEIFADVPDYTHKIVWKGRPKSLDDLKAVATRCRAVFAAQAEAAERADARADWSAMMVHFHNLDSLQHRLWPYLDVDDTGERRKGWNEEVVLCLKALDDASGRLMELASRRDAAVVAVSDHGFGPCRALVNVNGILQREGFQKRLAYGTRFRYRASRLRDRFRRWKTRHEPGGGGRRLARSIDGQVGCDWSRTAAFAPFGQLSACVFLHPEVSAHASKAARMTDDLLGLFREERDPDSGDLLFADAFSVADRYDLDTEGEGLPTVMAPSADGFQAQAKWSPFSSRLMAHDPNLPATHRMDGVVAIDAPDVRPGDTLHAELHDLAPTALAMLGVPVPETMEGRILHEAFETPLPVHYGTAPIVADDPRQAELLAAFCGLSE